MELFGLRTDDDMNFYVNEHVLEQGVGRHGEAVCEFAGLTRLARLTCLVLVVWVFKGVNVCDVYGVTQELSVWVVEAVIFIQSEHELVKRYNNFAI